MFHTEDEAERIETTPLPKGAHRVDNPVAPLKLLAPLKRTALWNKDLFFHVNYV